MTHHQETKTGLSSKHGGIGLSKYKIGMGGLVTALLVAFAAFGIGNAGVPTVGADIVDVYDIGSLESANDDEDFTDLGECAAPEDSVALDDGDAFVLGPDDVLWLCVVLDSEQGDSGTESADVTFDSDDTGIFTEAICSNGDGDGEFFEAGDECVSVEGFGTDEMTVDCTEQLGDPPCSNDDDGQVGGIIVAYTCNGDTGQFELTITSSSTDPTNANDVFTLDVTCRGDVARITISARPTTVEIVPARSNTSHSLITVTLFDENDDVPVSGVEVDFLVNRCSIETSGVDSESEYLTALSQVLALNTASPITYFNWETGSAASATVDSSRQADSTLSFDVDALNDGEVEASVAAAVLGCNPVDAPGATPGVATVQACVEIPGTDICATVDVTVIGPPSSITVAASPTSLRCGEKSTITVTVKDSIGQNVSDHTRVELITNLGGVLAGQGAVAGFAGPVVPISSSVGDTFGGVATAFLLTSESHSGPYEVVATSGGTTATDFFAVGSGSNSNIVDLNVLGGIFSTPPISAQVTVTCTIPAATAVPAATITAPRTGTGITPPNTGDGGLADSSSSWTLFALGGLAAFALAGLATAKFARR
jgi:hypothetical protein